MTGAALYSWITRESNTVRALYQKAQGNQPVLILSSLKALPEAREGGPQGHMSLESGEGVKPSYAVLQTTDLIGEPAREQKFLSRSVEGQRPRGERHSCVARGTAGGA